MKTGETSPGKLNGVVNTAWDMMNMIHDKIYQRETDRQTESLQ
jgi:hypothetical protein